MRQKRMDVEQIDDRYDLIVIGGGITGAGILREAVRMGFRTLMLEARDFAWGTSSRSSKLVHGGLRYLKTGQFSLTRKSVHERERLLKDAPGLVESMGFLVPVYRDRGPGRWALAVGLTLYDLIAGKRQHRFYGPDAFMALAPHIDPGGLLGGFRFEDAQTDDARLVLRLVLDAMAAGGHALNYTAADGLMRERDGRLAGVRAKDVETGAEREVYARAVVNATGCWAEQLHPSPRPGLHLRPLKGSHLVFPAASLPIDQGISFSHPRDHRAIFMVPWEKAVLVGTTDLDHDMDLADEPGINAGERDYLMEAVAAFVPSLGLSQADCIGAFTGVRPVLSRGDRPPSEESREHVVWIDQGLVTVTGGKLTTFRRLAWDALKAARAFLPGVETGQRAPAFDPPPEDGGGDLPVSPDLYRRLYGRYGNDAAAMVRTARPEDLAPIPGTRTLWAELAHAAQNERIRHLSDLLLRRVRIGMTTPNGGGAFMAPIQRLCRPHLPWDDRRWEKEIADYQTLWQRCYACSP
jgi:glycerol-3-phosphate dehydrogenase